MTAAEPADGKPKIPPAGPGAGKARPPAESDATKAVPAQSSEVVQKKKMMQHLVYFVSSLLQGARSRYSGVQKLLFGLLMASRKLRITSKPTRSLSSPASRCNGYCITQMQPEGLWNGPWSYQVSV